MTPGANDQSSDTQLRELQRREGILDALDRFLGEGPDGMAILFGATDVEHARRLLGERYDLHDEHASAVLDLQFRRAPAAERDRVRHDLDTVRADIRALRSR